MCFFISFLLFINKNKNKQEKKRKTSRAYWSSKFDTFIIMKKYQQNKSNNIKNIQQ